MVSHLIENFDDINTNRAFGHAASAAGALIVFVSFHKILVFMQDSLPQPGCFIRPGIVSRGVHGEIRKLTIVPRPYPKTFAGCDGRDFIGDVKTVAGRTEKSADSAAEATHRFLIPER
jgi:hypothetical protein